VIVLGPPALRVQLAQTAAQIAKNHAASRGARAAKLAGLKKAGTRR
jgi:hypothetical protein